jgi:hypothetical protein
LGKLLIGDESGLPCRSQCVGDYPRGPLKTMGKTSLKTRNETQIR